MAIMLMILMIWIPFLIVLWYSYFVIVLVLIKMLSKIRLLYSILNVIPSMLTLIFCKLSEHHDGFHALVFCVGNFLLSSLVLRCEKDV